MVNNDDSPPLGKEEITIIYDGICPVCNAYVRYTRLQNSLSIVLVDARQKVEVLSELKLRGLDLEEGMVVIFGGRYFHGADAMHLLASLTTRSGIVNQISYALFSNPKYSAIFYPILKQARSILLWLLRRPPLQT